MNNKRAPASSLTDSDELTVMVFKDNDTARSFQISLGWVARLGFGLGVLAMAALLGSFFALKFYRVARRTNPTHVTNLEQQLSDLKAANKGLESRIAAAAPAKSTVNILPVPTVTVTATVTPAAESTPLAVATQGGAPLFSALPRKTQDLTANASKLPISVSAARTSLSNSGRTFNVDFNIQYVGASRGSQQGRIIVLARGPNGLFVYPEGALGRAGGDSLILPQQGEYFSVSRFREVKAEFTDIRGAGKIQDVELMIMSLDDQLMFYQKIAVTSGKARNEAPSSNAATVTATPAPNKAETPVSAPAAATPPPPAKKAAAPKAAAPAKPKTDSTELIEPGVDQ